jgi:hypothetical protein
MTHEHGGNKKVEKTSGHWAICARVVEKKTVQSSKNGLESIKT